MSAQCGRSLAAALLAASLLACGCAERSSGITSLAVLPFTTTAGDQSQGHLTIGMADAIITRLASLQTLRIPPTATIRHFVGSKQAAAEIGRELGVDAVLTGTLTRTDDRLRINMQLTRVSDGGQLWAARFDERFTGIFSVQDAITEQVASSLLLDMRGAGTPRQTPDTAAYEIYLRGREQFARRSPDTIRTAIRMYEEAIRIDPSYAPAFAGLAECYAVTASGLPVATRYPLAKSNAEKAIALDGTLAADHKAMAFVLYKFEWRWRDSLNEFERAIALDPRFALARHWYGELLTLLGRHDQAYPHLQQALALEPSSTAIRVDFFLLLMRMNRVGEARTLVESGLQIDEHPRLIISMGDVRIAEGRIAEGVGMQWRGQRLQGTPEAELAAQRQAFAQGGLAAMNQRTIDLLSAQLAKGSATTPGQMGLSTRLATAYAAAFDRENTLRHLTTAIAGREDAALHLKLPQYDFLRGDARFESLVRRVGMP